MPGSYGLRIRGRAVISAGVFLASLVYLTLSMDQAVGIYDEGITLVGADRVLHGAIPHRDFYTLYGPGQYYVLAALYRAFGA